MIGSSCDRRSRAPGRTASSAPSFASPIRMAASTGWSQRGRPRRDSTGAVRWLRGTCFDITERKVLEVRLLALGEALEARVRERTQELEASNARLRESERRFRLLVEGVTDYAIFMLDPEGNGRQLEPRRGTPQGLCQHGNPRPALLALLHRGGQAERTPRAILRPGHRDREIREARAGVSARTAAGSGRAWSSTRSAIADGQLLGFAKVTRDLTERREARGTAPPGRRRWRRSASSPAGSRTTSTIC